MVGLTPGDNRTSTVAGGKKTARLKNMKETLYDIIASAEEKKSRGGFLSSGLRSWDVRDTSWQDSTSLEQVCQQKGKDALSLFSVESLIPRAALDSTHDPIRQWFSICGSQHLWGLKNHFTGVA